MESAPGLYFVGLAFQFAFASMLVGGAGRDAAYVVKHLAGRGRRRRARTRKGRSAGQRRLTGPTAQASGTISGAPSRAVSAVSSSGCSCDGRSASTRAR